MTILEFKTTNPSDYGIGNINMLYSSSISTGSHELPTGRYGSVTYDSSSIDSNGDTVYYFADAYFPPYSVIGLTIPFNSSNGISLEATLNQVTSIKFTIAGEIVVTPVIQISKQNNYFYLETTPVSIYNLPVQDDVEGTPVEFGVEFIFTPYLSGNFGNNDFNALQGNASKNLQSVSALEVDRETDSVNPSNLRAIIAKTATRAQVQYSNYTTAGWTNARYAGSKNIATLERDEPAMSFRGFQASIHPVDSDIDTILSSGQSDQNAKQVYFDADKIPTSLIASGSIVPAGSDYYTIGAYPIVSSSAYRGNILFETQGNDFIRVVDKKVHATDKGVVYTTNEFGIIINEQSGSQ